jgi:hypothetical protein
MMGCAQERGLALGFILSNCEHAHTNSANLCRELANVHVYTFPASLSRIQALVHLLLATLDLAHERIDALARALKTDNPDAIIIERDLQCAWSQAHTAILVLEMISGCREVHARRAFAYSCARGRQLCLLASAIGSAVQRTRKAQYPENTMGTFSRGL